MVTRNVGSAVRSRVLNGIKRAGRRVGLEIKQARNELDEETVLRQLFAEHQFDLVADVGANEGQYARALRGYGYTGRIVSFEPLPEAHAKLLDASRSDANWTVPEPAAVGAERGVLEINVAGNSASSSLLPMLGRHVDAAPHSRYVRTLPVPIAPLDELLPPLLGGAKAILLKIDTQGYEDRVLQGARQVLHACRAVQVELSLTALYDGQASSAAIVAKLDQAGLQLAYIVPGFRDPHSGRLLQFDGIFVRA